MIKKNTLIPIMALALLLPFAALADTNYSTDLSGAEEVPSVQTEATGEFMLQFNEDATAADFTLEVADGEAVTMAHLHCAPAGENGPVIATLFGSVLGGFDVDGTLADFTLTDANIHEAGADCDTAVTDIESLETAITDGIIYSNVHTVEYPNGEIRGQLGTSTDQDGSDDDDDNGTGTDDDDSNGTSTDDNRSQVRQEVNEIIQDVLSAIEEIRASIDAGLSRI